MQANWAHDTSGDNTLRGVPAALGLSEMADEEECNDGATETGRHTETEYERVARHAREHCADDADVLDVGAHVPFFDDGQSDQALIAPPRDALLCALSLLFERHVEDLQQRRALLRQAVHGDQWGRRRARVH
ncbi:hypothetical protein FA95DRAFT_1611219 [Auriscalpium vulgare]|uniref:Uncharacterized protein n=1 Tax=Auriscalpium vulgare TaxID=40419 RepID=A0ACB8RB55_9AGAM|nr:hypothetical protein FA95DRAFT_1611219 [Auriscalpium vulgare]